MRSLLLMCFVSSVAFAQEASKPLGFEISLKAGAHFPQVVSELGTSFDGILKVGYAPLASRQLQFFADLGYTQPSQTVTGEDPRLGDAGRTYSSTLVLRDLATSVGASWYFLPAASNLQPYAGAGLRIHFLSAEVDGSAQAAFGPAKETDTRFGALVFGGTGYRIGPGMVLGELAFDYTPLDHVVTGPSNAGSLSVRVGYGLMF